MAYDVLLAKFGPKRYLSVAFVLIVTFDLCCSVHMNGFRVEMFSADNFTTNSLGRVDVVGGHNLTVRLFTFTPLPSTAEISFTTVSAQPDADCSDLRSTNIFPVQTNVVNRVHSSTAHVRLPSDPELYMFCVRTEPSTTWRHQGNSSWLQLGVAEGLVGEPAESRPSLPLWVYVVLIIVLTLIAAACTGLSVSVLSLSRAELKQLRAGGSSDERSYAKAVSPLRRRGNRFLCGIVFISVVCCAAASILIEDMIQCTIAALGISSALILILVVFIPLVVCPRVRLSCVTRTMWLAKIIVVLTFPLSYMVGRLMDWLSWDDLPSMRDRSRISNLQRAQQPSVVVKETEEEAGDRAGGIGSSVLGLSEKTVKDLMTKIDDVFMIEFSTIVDEKCLESVAASGYTRIPVYEMERTNIVALLHVCDLAYVSAGDGTSLRNLCKFYNRPVNFVFEDTKLEILLAEFKKGRSADS